MSAIIRSVVSALALVAFSTLSAQRVSPPAGARPMDAAAVSAAPADSIHVYLLTMGQGDQVWELFGHNGIWVRDPSRPVDLVYHWGVFDFNAPGFIPKFLLGDMRYTMDSISLDATIAGYRYLNRQVWAQELRLTQDEARELVAFLRWNIRPENRGYRYDYYLDNCSTRVRDAIDRVLKGSVRSHLQSIPSTDTYRSHSLRLMQRERLMVSGVEVALGRPTDFLLNADQASFLPVQLMEHLRTLKLDGGTRPLVGEEFVVYEATRPPEPATVPALWKGFVPIGLLLAALVLLPALAGPGALSARVMAVSTALIAGFIGLIGTIITLLATVTDHVAAHWNENLFLLNPVWLAVAVVVPVFMLKGRRQRGARILAMVAAALAISAVLLHLVGLSDQPNWDVIALLLPVELAIAFVTIRLSRNPPAAAVAGSPTDPLQPRTVPDAQPGGSVS